MDTNLGKEGAHYLDISTPTRSSRTSSHIPRTTSWTTPIPPPSFKAGPATADAFHDVAMSVNSLASIMGDRESAWNSLDNIAALGLSLSAEDIDAKVVTRRERFSIDDCGSAESQIFNEKPRRFDKWVRNIQRRALERRQTVSCDKDCFTRDMTSSGISPSQRKGHKKSSSASSIGFVTAVKSASISLASFSVAPRSGRTAASSRHQRTELSNNTSNFGRDSEDSPYMTRGIDQAATNRLIQRRRILEELIHTEESYVADVKFLMNVYITLLASMPPLTSNLRASINRNLNEIVDLHEELLGDLHRAVPHSEYTQVELTESKRPSRVNGHSRWRSLDAIPERLGHTNWLQKIPGMTADPKVGAEVARVFGKRMGRFFIYEEYGAKYELMMKDMASTYRTIPQFDAYQKGIEALASSLASINRQSDNTRKSSTVGDLLVKPIQRVCKYPLLFAELLKQTPVCDCPTSHLEIENVLVRLREATVEINRATNDPNMKAILEKTWLLQDRLTFPNQSEARSNNAVRALGHVHLCGVLHASWQTRDGVDGQYMVSLLYRDFMILASAEKSDQTYVIQACIGLAGMRLEGVDNGRGLQCHTAPFSWKLVFESDHLLFELTMSACSPKEESEWRSRLQDQSCRNDFAVAELALLESQSLDIKPLGTVFGKPGTITRRIAVQRATTIGSMSGLSQVIIKNTNATKDLTHSSSSISINRSQSLLATNRVPVLAPPRTDRVRLESLLSDVWTRESLPYPGMTSRARKEILTRASASNMMRKLSVASIASNFTKRSGSIASLSKAAEDDTVGGDLEMAKSSSVRVEPRTYEFHLFSNGEDVFESRLSIIQDEKENTHHGSVERHTSTETAPSSTISSTASTVSTMRRLKTLKVKKSWGLDGQRIVTPPLRASSANSVIQNQTKATNLSAVELNSEAKENRPHSTSSSPAPSPTQSSTHKQGKRGRIHGKSRAVVAEGIRNFFR